jgi:hypothetical protein
MTRTTKALARTIGTKRSGKESFSPTAFIRLTASTAPSSLSAK